jgi:hypothetical protein
MMLSFLSRYLLVPRAERSLATFRWQGRNGHSRAYTYPYEQDTSVVHEVT